MAPRFASAQDTLEKSRYCSSIHYIPSRLGKDNSTDYLGTIVRAQSNAISIEANVLGLAVKPYDDTFNPAIRVSSSNFIRSGQRSAWLPNLLAE